MPQSSPPNPFSSGVWRRSRWPPVAAAISYLEGVSLMKKEVKIKKGKKMMMMMMMMMMMEFAPFHSPSVNSFLLLGWLRSSVVRGVAYARVPLLLNTSQDLYFYERTHGD